MTAVDLFAGAGGWDEGIAPLGIRPLGIEWNADACATREAAGHLTLQADVSALDPVEFAPCELLLGSPPCPTFSAAGDGNGLLVGAVILRCARSLLQGFDTRDTCREAAYNLIYDEVLEAEADRAFRRNKAVDYAKVEARARRDATMSLLVVEPLRWVLALRPGLVALEQVPGVLPLWQAFGEMLRELGYSVWAGKLSAERFGVPQTRERAFLLASLHGPVQPPRPTHQAYEYGVPAQEVHTLEGTLAPWVSMAEALQWGMTERPSTTLTAGSNRHGTNPLDGGSGSRARLEREREREEVGFRLHRGSGMTDRYGERRDTPLDEPTPTITSKARTARWYDRRQGHTDQGGVRTMVRLIPDSEPSPTISTESESRDRWVYVNGNQDHAARRSSSAPAPTVHFGHASLDAQWVEERPATSVMADSRVFQPGGHHEPGEQSQNAVTVTEAAVLQSFPPDYPWQGSRTARFTQIGNAVPPLLARAVIAALIGAMLEEAA